MSRVFPIVLLFVLPLALAQQTNPNRGGSTGTDTTPRTPRAPSNPSNTPAPSNQLPNFQATPEVIFISGSVIQEDGSPPPFGTEIELDCGNTVTREATVNPDGSYGFEVGSNSNRLGRVMPDASDNYNNDPFDLSRGGIGSYTPRVNRATLASQLMRCELRARYAGYRSMSVRMAPGKIFGFTEVNPIVIYQVEKFRGTTVSASSLMAPKDVKKSIERASKALKESKFDEVETILKTSLEKYPKNAEALFLLGLVYHMQARHEDAEQNYLKAINIDKFFVRPYILLAKLAVAQKDWKEAAELTNKVLELDPVTYPETYLLNSLAYFHLEDLDTSEKSARKGLRLDFENRHPQMHLILANIMTRNNDVPGSLQEMRLYLKAAPDASDAAHVRSRLEESERLFKASAR
jgi:tetratricopeptide (TPR) repeat protein